MGDVVLLSNIPIDLLSDTGHAFVVDCTRAGEKIITDKELTEKYDLSPADWQNISKNSELGRAVRAERERRMFTGIAAREAACRHFVKAPGILNSIMSSEEVSPRHRIQAAQEIRTVASGGSGADRPTESNMFIIKIDLSAGGGPVETYSKEINTPTVDPNNTLEGKPDGDGQW